MLKWKPKTLGLQLPPMREEMIWKSQSEFVFYIAWYSLTFIYDLLTFRVVVVIVEEEMQRNGKPGYLKMETSKGKWDLWFWLYMSSFSYLVRDLNVVNQEIS